MSSSVAEHAEPPRSPRTLEVDLFFTYAEDLLRVPRRTLLLSGALHRGRVVLRVAVTRGRGAGGVAAHGGRASEASSSSAQSMKDALALRCGVLRYARG